MELREELTPRPISVGALSTLCDQLEELTALVEHGKPHARELAAFNAAVGGRFDTTDIGGVHAAESPEDFVRHALDRPRRVHDITRDELIEIVNRVGAGVEDSDFYLELFESNVPHPEASDLIYWPPDELLNASSEEIVDAALRYDAPGDEPV